MDGAASESIRLRSVAA